MNDKVPLRRWGKPKILQTHILFWRVKMSYISGAVLNVDGGVIKLKKNLTEFSKK